MKIKNDNSGKRLLKVETCHTVWTLHFLFDKQTIGDVLLFVQNFEAELATLTGVQG